MVKKRGAVGRSEGRSGAQSYVNDCELIIVNFPSIF